MPSACNNIGIIPNTDISGIGVRVAIYARAILTLVQPILASMDGHIGKKELISHYPRLSVYHAVIVLQLSWINNTSALIFFQFAIIAQIILNVEIEFHYEPKWVGKADKKWTKHQIHAFKC
ncbi:hypothetical protein CVT25_008300 [Psilocybe cyanescens]|uniref:Uncharacterized protein n=1 Tax=Psilocybe cyanescens TaxID=93625 RepID=A0A409XJI5_PSICY|nr:hypothetical protein CVT25_008300 [Psilocybe cyanescens]